jgi:UDP:flavonoid glycosyltransferase YjiC (YdhE family)
VRIGIQTWGSEGDLRPFFALGRGLAARGHEVSLAYTSVEGRDYAELAARCGIRAQAVGHEVLRALRAGGEGAPPSLLSASPMRQLRWVIERYHDPIREHMWTAAQALAERADVLVGHFTCHPLTTAAQRAGRPAVSIATAPMLPTRWAPPPGAPDLGPLNRLSWRLIERFADALFLAPANALRARAGIPLLRGIQRDGLRTVAGLLTAVSPTLFPQPRDWPEKAPVVGFLELPAAAEPWAPAPELDAFLAAGPPPVLLTFGSMTSEPRLAAGAVELLRGAAERAGIRALLQAPPGVAPGRAGEDLYVLGPAPHAAILPRCAAVVHHGGAGTVQATARAGLPSVVVPHVVDQFFWGAALHARGVAPRPLPRRKATPAALAARIREAVASEPMRARAAGLGASMRAEDGVGRAIEWIERAVPPR